MHVCSPSESSTWHGCAAHAATLPHAARVSRRIRFRVPQPKHRGGGACAQVEHGITEMVSGLDLVEMQLELQVPGLKARPQRCDSARTLA